MTRVEKWHGAGNDFIVVDGRGLAADIEWSAWARAVCDRRRGIGGDGLLVLENHPSLDFRMRYWNADGSLAAMCGNGGRVLSSFADAHGLGKDSTVCFESGWGEHRARVERESADRYQVRLSLPDVSLPTAVEVEAPWSPQESVKGLRVDSGVPHLVVSLSDAPIKNLDDVPVEAWGEPLCHAASLAPAGANIDFVAVSATGPIRVRTFERGVEGETLACGTGATAVAAAAEYANWRNSPVSIETRSGDRLEVEYERAGDILTSVTLSGPAVRVFSAEYPGPA